MTVQGAEVVVDAGAVEGAVAGEVLVGDRQRVRVPDRAAVAGVGAIVEKRALGDVRVPAL